MCGLSLSDVLERREIADIEVIEANIDEQVLAVDVDGPWGAVFSFSVDSTGAWYSETACSQRIAEERRPLGPPHHPGDRIGPLRRCRRRQSLRA